MHQGIVADVTAAARDDHRRSRRGTRQGRRCSSSWTASRIPTTSGAIVRSVDAAGRSRRRPSDAPRRGARHRRRQGVGWRRVARAGRRRRQHRARDRGAEVSRRVDDWPGRRCGAVVRRGGLDAAERDRAWRRRAPDCGGSCGRRAIWSCRSRWRDTSRASTSRWRPAWCCSRRRGRGEPGLAAERAEFERVHGHFARARRWIEPERPGRSRRHAEVPDVPARGKFGPITSGLGIFTPARSPEQLCDGRDG